MSTYLNAFIVGDFGAVEGEDVGSKTRFRVLTRMDADFLDAATYAAGVGPTVLKAFEDYFRIPYAMEKMASRALKASPPTNEFESLSLRRSQDMAGIPDLGSSATENWGLVTYREEYLLVFREASVAEKRHALRTIVHELAHQWFGNLVRETSQPITVSR